MVNNTSETKLDTTIKKTLAGYEAPYDPSNWEKMESMLGSVPNVSSVKWQPIIGIAAIALISTAAYILYTSSNTSTPPAENTVTDSSKQKINTPAIVPTNVSAAAVSEEVKRGITAPYKIISSKPPINITGVEERTPDEIKELKTIAEPDHTQSILGVGNEPVFGDMLDTSQGFITQTSEKETAKKTAKPSKNLPVGWDNFMLRNVNPDSLKKYRQQRDSAKVQ
jgi:hypothetical protein